MKPWISRFIKEHQLGYLSIVSDKGVEIHSIIYWYDNGKLYFTKSILSHQLINALTSYPRVSLLILNDNYQVQIHATSSVQSDNLVRGVRYSKDPTVTVFPELGEFRINDIQLPHLEKRVLIELTPTRIWASNGTTIHTYDLEVVV